MYNALRYGRGTVPIEIPCLQMAEAWGQHPEDIKCRKGGLKWAAWFNLYREELARAKKNTSS